MIVYIYINVIWIDKQMMLWIHERIHLSSRLTSKIVAPSVQKPQIPHLWRCPTAILSCATRLWSCIQNTTFTQGLGLSEFGVIEKNQPSICSYVFRVPSYSLVLIHECSARCSANNHKASCVHGEECWCFIEVTSAKSENDTFLREASKALMPEMFEHK